MPSKRATKKPAPAPARKRAATPKAAIVPGPAETERKSNFRKEDLDAIRPHAIALRAGKFIAGDDYSTTPADVDRIFNDHLPKSKKKKLLIWAHGGLVSQKDALQHVIDHLPGWTEADIYPLYFIWKTDIWTSLRDILLGVPQAGERGFSDWSDALLEKTLHQPALKVWSQIKDYARLSSEKDGGAYYTAKKLAEFAKKHPDVEIYVAGHSAGSNFHSWFLPAAIDLGVTFKDLFLLAPAVTVPEFNSRLAPRIGAGKGITHTTLFTMNETAELADNCAKIYRKSLLYFVSRACEPVQPTPILGLQESLKASPSLKALFGIGVASSKGEVIWSPNGRTEGTSASNSTSHGGFDNDYTTLNSLARRITGNSSLTVFEPEKQRAAEDLGIAVPQARGERQPRRRAVCVGIDEYPTSPLYGCVNDAKEWQSVLSAAGFETELLANGQATRAGLVRVISDLIEGSRPGDVLVLQCASHGASLPDADGDEEDGKDEAVVPFDYEDGNFLIDDDLGDLLDRVPAGVSFTCFMDCCYSSENTRIFAPKSLKNPGELERYLPIPEDIARQHVINRKSAPPRLPRSVYSGKPEVNFTACRSDQTAKEKDGHGYFTTVATRILRGNISGLTHEEFLKRIRAEFPLPASSQEPQLNSDESRNSGILFQPPVAAPARLPEVPGISIPLPDAAGCTEARLLIQTLHDAMHVLRKLVG